MANGKTLEIRQQSLLHSTAIVSSMTMLSRVMGFVRDMLIAHLFGAGAGVDAFFVAFKIPNFLRRMFAEGAFSQAFVPVLSSYQNQRSDQEVKLFLSHVAGLLGVILLVVTGLCMIFSPALVKVFAPGFASGSLRYAQASQMLAVTFPYLFFISLTAFAGAILNTYGFYGVPAFTPVLLNIALIIAAVYVAPAFAVPVYALAWGVFAAGAIQLLFQIPFLYRLRLLPWPRIAWRDPGVRRVLKMMVPALFGVSVAQVNLLMDTLFASFLPVGSITWLYFSDRLSNFPLGVFGVAISTVILPHLSRHHASQSPDNYGKTVDWAIRMVLLIAIPATVGLILLSGQVLAALFQYGKFTAIDVLQAQKSLMAFAFGLPAFMIIKVLASGFYAAQNIKTPVKIGALAMLVNIVLNLILIKPLAHAGLALSTSLAAYFNAGCLLWLLIRKGVYHSQAGWLKFTLQATLANAVVIVWILLAAENVRTVLSWGWQYRAWHVFMIISVAMIIYVMCLRVMGLSLSQFRGRVPGQQ